MIANWRKLATRFIAIAARSFSSQKTAFNFSRIKNPLTFRKILLGCGLMLGLNYVHPIEDEAIRNVRAQMGKHINALRS